jgi:hypothetical protein
MKAVRRGAVEAIVFEGDINEAQPSIFETEILL